MTKLDLRSFDADLKDMYALPGTRLKQWVVDERAQAAWERATCPKVGIKAHDDNTGAQCRNSGDVPWTYLDHDCCYQCGDMHQMTRMRPDIVAWQVERDTRPPVCADRDKLSDEIEPERGPLRSWPAPRST